MNIKPKYVTFGQAKLLKEKGFDNISCRSLYFPDGEFVECEVKKAHDNYLRPEQHIVVEWLRINHGIWVSPYMASSVSWGFHVLRVSDGHVIGRNEGLVNSPQEAYSAAFDYILKELI